MHNLLQFLKAIRDLRDVKRQGVLYYGVKGEEVDSAADHSFRLAMMVWLLGQGKRLNLSKAMKLALVHDVCKVVTGDITPYQGLFKKNDKNHRLAWRWRRLSLQEKKKQYKDKSKKEEAAMKKLTGKMPFVLKKEILGAWHEYQKGESPEARFVFQVDRLENLLEATEHFQDHKDFPTQPWWEHADEVVSDKTLLSLMEEISEEESRIAEKRARK